MIRFTGRLSLVTTSGFLAFVFATSVFVTPISVMAFGGQSPETKPEAEKVAKDRAAEERGSDSQASDDEEVRSFAPVETESDPLPGIRLPVEMRTGESPFLSDSVQRRIALGILLVFAVILLFTLIMWRKRPEPEAIETPPPVDGPSYEEVLAAAAERERIKQLSQRR